MSCSVVWLPNSFSKLSRSRAPPCLFTDAWLKHFLHLSIWSSALVLREVATIYHASDYRLQRDKLKSITPKESAQTEFNLWCKERMKEMAFSGSWKSCCRYKRGKVELQPTNRSMHRQECSRQGVYSMVRHSTIFPGHNRVYPLGRLRFGVRGSKTEICQFGERCHRRRVCIAKSAFASSSGRSTQSVTRPSPQIWISYHDNATEGIEESGSCIL